MTCYSPNNTVNDSLLVCIDLVFQSFILYISTVPLALGGDPDYSIDTVEALQTNVSEGLNHGPYVATKLGVEPATIWAQDTEPITEPPRPTIDRATVSSVSKVPFSLRLL